MGEYLADADYGLATTVHIILHALVLGYQATFTLMAWLLEEQRSQAGSESHVIS